MGAGSIGGAAGGHSSALGAFHWRARQLVTGCITLLESPVSGSTAVVSRHEVTGS